MGLTEKKELKMVNNGAKKRRKKVQSTENASYNKGWEKKREVCSYGRDLLLGLKLFCWLAGWMRRDGA
jgi:hypothetical protein